MATAYRAAAVRIRKTLAEGRIDVRSFERKLARCDLRACKSMCCSQGVHLNEEDAAALREIIAEHADALNALGVAIPSDVVEPSASVAGYFRTVRRAREPEEILPDLPPGFGDRACIFLLHDARCSLQVVSESLGRHPWDLKPLPCWLHPIRIAPAAPATVRLARQPDVPQGSRRATVTDTGCGATDPEGIPGYEAVQAELGYLGRIVGRDLAGAVRSWWDQNTRDD